MIDKKKSNKREKLTEDIKENEKKELDRIKKIQKKKKRFMSDFKRFYSFQRSNKIEEDSGEEFEENKLLFEQQQQQQQFQQRLEYYNEQLADDLFDNLQKVEQDAKDGNLGNEHEIDNIFSIEEDCWKLKRQIQEQSSKSKNHDFSLENNLQSLRIISNQINQNKSFKNKWHILYKQYLLSKDNIALSINGEVETKEHWEIYDGFFKRYCGFEYPGAFKQHDFSGIDNYFVILRRAMLVYLAFYEEYDQWPTKENYKAVLDIKQNLNLIGRFEYTITIPNLPHDWVISF
jgi:hypothetical protein